jgi:hypothetical protein
MKKDPSEDGDDGAFFFVWVLRVLMVLSLRPKQPGEMAPTEVAA